MLERTGRVRERARCSQGADRPRGRGQTRRGTRRFPRQTREAPHGSRTPVLRPDLGSRTRRRGVLHSGPGTWPLGAASQSEDRPAQVHQGTREGACHGRSVGLTGRQLVLCEPTRDEALTPEPDRETEARRTLGVQRQEPVHPPVHTCSAHGK